MNIIISLDYELFFGSNSGTVDKTIIIPSNELLKIVDSYDVKLSFFVDSGYILKLGEYKSRFSELKDDYKKIVDQISLLSAAGHDVQLHIHPHWENSFYKGSNGYSENGKWVINTEQYKLSDFAAEQIDDIVARYKEVLVNITGKEIFAYRAGGWCIQPFDIFKEPLYKNGIWLDSTVFKNGRNFSHTHRFNFSNCPNKTKWRFHDDPLVENINGEFVEVPISSIELYPLFYLKLAYFKKFGGRIHKPFGDGHAIANSIIQLLKFLTKRTTSVVSIDGYKSKLLEKAFKNYKDRFSPNDNFVIMGHPKALTKYGLSKLDEFINSHYKAHNFTTYSNEFSHHS